MKAIKDLIIKYGISNEDIQKIIQYLILGKVKEAQIDGVIINKYLEITKECCSNIVNRKPETNIGYDSTLIQEWAMLYLESLEKELNDGI